MQLSFISRGKGSLPYIIIVSCLLMGGMGGGRRGISGSGQSVSWHLKKKYIVRSWSRNLEKVTFSMPKKGRRVYLLWYFNVNMLFLAKRINRTLLLNDTKQMWVIKNIYLKKDFGRNLLLKKNSIGWREWIFTLQKM